MSDHDLVIALDRLLGAYRGSYAEKYAWFSHRNGKKCPFAAKAFKMYQRKDRENLLRLANRLKKILEED